MQRIALAALAAAALAGTAAAEDISGAVYGYYGPGVYDVVDDIYVPSGQTLTLAAGVTFRFEDGTFEEYEFDVNGTLLAQGTESQPVVFEPAPGVDEYNYIRISTSSSQLEHCIVEGAGKVSMYSEGGLWIDGCSPTLFDCEVYGGSWHGVYVTGSGAQPKLYRCSSHDNGSDGVDCDDGAGLWLENCEVVDNGGDGVCLSDGTNRLIGCLVAGNGEDGIDCHGTSDYAAVILNCTIGSHPSEALSDCSEFDMINCAVVGDQVELGSGTHTWVTEDQSFFGFSSPASGNYRLTASSPCRDEGNRFGAASSLLPDQDLDGNPRINGIVDVGAYESTLSPPTGEEGEYFSSALLVPRMTRPVIRTAGGGFTAQVACLGEWSTSEVSAQLVDPLGGIHPLTVSSVAHVDRTPGSETALRLYGPGIERVQEIGLDIPASVPEDLYDIRIDLGDLQYQSQSAVKVLEEYPESWGFLHITDTHVGYDEEDYTAAERLGFFAIEANFLNPEFVVVTGDICENQNLDNQWADTLLARVSQFRVPVLLVPGNHDHYNDGGSAYYPHAYMRYYHDISRCVNTEFAFDGCLLYGLSSGPDQGLSELWRCVGPTDEALDWVEDRLTAGSAEGPFFYLTHGPVYDYFSWCIEGTARVRDMLEDYGFSLALAGHTHRFETFLNEGTNWFGRNDFSHNDDWGRDVVFPGYPLHVQTSSLGKEEHISWAEQNSAGGMIDRNPEMRERLHPEEDGRGIFGDSIGWRWIQIQGSGVEFFTADTDDDGWRNTENPWILGELTFSIDSFPSGEIHSSVYNAHYEPWYDVRHYIQAEPGVEYEITGGELLRQFDDGLVEVAVDSVASASNSMVILVPSGTGIAGAGTDAVPAVGRAAPNPFSTSTVVRCTLPTVCAGSLEAAVYDVTGRRVRDLQVPSEPGRASIVWDGSGADGRRAASGMYLIRVSWPGGSANRRVALLD